MSKNLWKSQEAQTAGVPSVDKTGCIPTRNGKGWMTTRLDPVSQSWVEHAAGKGTVMDIGCAYGVAVREALEAGATVYALDSGEEHLRSLSRLTPIEQLRRLHTVHASFPDELPVGAGTIDAVLSSRVFHFFDGATIERAVDAIWKVLRPGSYVYIVADSPYLGTLKDFIPAFEQARLEGVEWPGMADMRIYEPEMVGIIPDWMHFLCPHVLCRVFGQRGFIVHEASLFARGARDGFPKFLRLDGREGVGFIGQKPL